MLFRSRGIPRRVLSGRGEMAFGGATVQALSDAAAEDAQDGTLDKEKFTVENDLSLVLRIKYGSFSLLLPGDAQEAAQDAMVAVSPPLPLKSTVMKAPHHGGRNSLSDTFFTAVRPEVAVISVGRSYSRRHIPDETEDFLSGLGARVFTTARDGSVTVSSDGKSYGFMTYAMSGTDSAK